MRALATLLLAFLLSGIIAGGVQIQLGIAFKADLELVLPMFLLMLMTLVTTITLGVTFVRAASVTTIDRVAFALLAFTVLATLALMVLEFVATRSIVLSRASLAILMETAIPIIVMITIQWWLVRRRWRKTHPGAETV
jgi:hypothetical protein